MHTLKMTTSTTLPRNSRVTITQLSNKTTYWLTEEAQAQFFGLFKGLLPLRIVRAAWFLGLFDCVALKDETRASYIAGDTRVNEQVSLSICDLSHKKGTI